LKKSGLTKCIMPARRTNRPRTTNIRLSEESTSFLS
jgi:hypothetical protein